MQLLYPILHLLNDLFILLIFSNHNLAVIASLLLFRFGFKDGLYDNRCDLL